MVIVGLGWLGHDARPLGLKPFPKFQTEGQSLSESMSETRRQLQRGAAKNQPKRNNILAF